MFQIVLLEECWKDLFILHLAQWSLSVDLKTILQNAKPVEDITNDENGLRDISMLQDVLRRFRQLGPDAVECACLKSIVLFQPGELQLTFSKQST